MGRYIYTEERRQQNRDWYIRNKEKRLAWCKAYRARHLAKIQADQKRYNQSERGKEIIRKSQLKYRAQNPEKRSAQSQVQHALLSGKLKRPERCSRCQKRRKLEAHHEDYSKPLEVVWLCKQCHAFTHRKRG